MKYVRLEVLHKDLTEEGRRKVITLISCILFRFLFEDKIHIKVLFFLGWVLETIFGVYSLYVLMLEMTM